MRESCSHIAVLVWAATWLPGLAFAVWRMECLLRTARRSRALLELVAVLFMPLLAFGGYALSDAQRYAQAHNVQMSWGAYLSVAQVAIPYVTSAMYLMTVWRPGASHPTASRWWVALLLGFLSAFVLTPGLLMAQLMVLVSA